MHLYLDTTVAGLPQILEELLHFLTPDAFLLDPWVHLEHAFVHVNVFRFDFSDFSPIRVLDLLEA